MRQTSGEGIFQNQHSGLRHDIRSKKATGRRLPGRGGLASVQQSGRTIGSLTIVNPFIESAP
jgi:hypothetical protein